MNSLILKTKRAVIFGKNLFVTLSRRSAETLGTREQFSAIGVQRKRVKEKGRCGGEVPHLKGGQSPQFKLFLCLYSWLSRHFSPFSPPKTPCSRQGPQACWVVIKPFSSKLKNNGCFPIYFDALNNFLLSILSIGSL